MVPLHCFFLNCWLAASSFSSAILSCTGGLLVSEFIIGKLNIFTTEQTHIWQPLANSSRSSTYLFIATENFLYCNWKFNYMQKVSKVSNYHISEQLLLYFRENFNKSWPLIMSGLLWPLVILDDGFKESSVSFPMLIATNSSFIPGAFSVEDRNSSMWRSE